jgi:hypothetical protein
MFKVGDWVRYKDGSVVKLVQKLNDTCTKETLFRTRKDLEFLKDMGAELWQPKEGEWCWFYNKTRDIPVLRMFSHFNEKAVPQTDNYEWIGDEKIYKCFRDIYKSSTVGYWIAEPLIGELPLSLKGL